MTMTPASAAAPSVVATRGSRLARQIGVVAVGGWAVLASGALVMDHIGPEGARPDPALFEAQLSRLTADRDALAAKAAGAEQRFAAAVDQVSVMQDQLFASEKRRRELESGIGAIQASLHDARDDAAGLRDQLAEAADARDAAGKLREMAVAIDALSAELKTASAERTEATRKAAALTAERDRMVARNEQIFAELEEAVEMSVKPLDEMIAKVGLDSDKLLETVREGYEGTGGPLTPMGYSSRGNAAITESEARAKEVVVSLGRLSNYRIAVSQLPLAMPVKSAFRFTSGYGQRWGRAHQGIDMAGPVGTPIYATGDGVVVFAGWQRGYGNMIKIQHAMGTETRYGHLSKMNVRAGQRVSRNSLIGAMGNTGRSTGPHLHYEVRVDGKAVNPMSFIKAAQNVF